MDAISIICPCFPKKVRARYGKALIQNRIEVVGNWDNASKVYYVAERNDDSVIYGVGVVNSNNINEKIQM